MSQPYEFDWSKIAFGKKSEINDLRPIFIAAPREISTKRFIQLVKTYLPAGNIVIGLAKEDYIDGFDGQEQFRTLQMEVIAKTIERVNASASKHKIYTLNYHQRESRYVLDELKFKRVIFINGSWLHAFHTRSEFYIVTKRRLPYELVSPFVDEKEAVHYASIHIQKTSPSDKELQTASEMLSVAASVAKQSFDYMFQTGVSLGLKEKKGKYKLLATAFNKVVPYQTYAMHHGASRETNFSPPNDLNHYDTVHAEVELLINAQKNQLSLTDATLFINLLPCPSCSRMIADTDIKEVVYQQDHSNGYAVTMLEAAGKTVTRLVV